MDSGNFQRILNIKKNQSKYGSQNKPYLWFSWFFPYTAIFKLKNQEYESYFFSPDEVDDMESLLHITGIGDYLDQLIIPSHK